MNKKEIIKRYIVLSLGLMLAGFGVAIAKIAELGVSPISSTPNVLSEYLPQLSLGVWIIIWNCILIIGQILVLRKDFNPIQFLQLPISFIFGYCTDLGIFCFSWLPMQTYFLQILFTIVGIAVLALGLTFSITANVVMNSGEAMVKAISDASKKDFGFVKIIFDVCCVVLATILSMIFFNFEIVGIREGTIISALTVGFFVKFFSFVSKKPLTLFMTK